jgi:hypothetical protein
MESYKNKFPFKLGTTSYILPVKEDSLSANVRFLKDRVDLVQLLFMGREYLGEIMSPSIIVDLKTMREESGVSYTVHLPADLDLLNPSEEKIGKSVDVIENIMAETVPLNIEGYILHVDRFLNGAARADLDPGGYRNFRTALDIISGRMGADAKKIYIENTTYELLYFKDIILTSPFPVCMDAGHLFFLNQDFGLFVEAFGQRTGQIHLHGFIGGKDHKAVDTLQRGAVNKIVGFQKSYSCPLILEVFNLEDLERSASYFKSFYSRA